MNRADNLKAIRDRVEAFDIAIIGGGATGLGIAVDAASRGHAVALFEQADFAKGTSSRSTKLVHGGVRYLQQGNVALVIDALRERGIMRRNAPHLVHDLSFIVPSYEWWQSPFYGIGLRVYDLLAGRFGFTPSKHLSKEEVVASIPSIRQHGLRGGTRYSDGQFDDARLAINLAQTACEQGAAVLNYAPVVGLHKDALGALDGLAIRDDETGEHFSVGARVVVNATGPFTDALRRLDRPDAEALIAPSQGVHIVLDSSFLPGDAAIMVPHTDDGRVMFAIPWHGVVVVGTTDTPVSEVLLEPRALDEEIGFILDTTNRYLTRPATRADVKSVFAGIRPLVRGDNTTRTASLSRDHTLLIDPDSGLITIAGGKWTTYRKMAEDAVDQAADLAGLPDHPCVTRQLPIHGYHQSPGRFGPLAYYGSDAPAIKGMAQSAPDLAQRVHPGLELTRAQVLWACRNEMARQVDDVLARRSRALLLDARAALQAAPAVAGLMADELERDAAWVTHQVQVFAAIVQGYLAN